MHVFKSTFPIPTPLTAIATAAAKATAKAKAKAKAFAPPVQDPRNKRRRVGIYAPSKGVQAPRPRLGLVEEEEVCAGVGVADEIPPAINGDSVIHDARIPPTGALKPRRTRSYLGREGKAKPTVSIWPRNSINAVSTPIPPRPLPHASRR